MDMDFNSFLGVKNGSKRSRSFLFKPINIVLVGDALVLVSISRTPSLIRPSNVLLPCLAFNGLCIGLFFQPLYIEFEFAQFTDTEKKPSVSYKSV